jgi:uncharacterized protein
MIKPLMLMLLLAPAISAAASFDCSKAASQTETAICNDPELSKLDDELGVIYQRAKADAADQNAFKEQTRAAWQWREAHCRSKACLVDWYAQRKAVLLKLSGSGGDTSCLKAGLVKLDGSVVTETLKLEPDGRQSTVYLLNTKNPVCVHVEPIDAGEATDVMVNRFQLVGDDAVYARFRQYLLKQAAVDGVLTTDNVSQYYAEANAIKVKSISVP